MPLDAPTSALALTTTPEDLEACVASLARGSKTFSASARLLPARIRMDATVLYAFCREADDAIDSDPLATRATVEALGRRLDAAYAGTPRETPTDRALSVLVRSRALPRPLLDALLDGLAWDADGRRYETLEDLYGYAARVAGTVGATMTLIMGERDPDVLARATDLGVAMQLTNIARDVGEDAQRGRIYLPLSWMREEGLDPERWLAAPTHDPRLAAVVARLLRAAATLYRRADDGIGALPADCRFAIRAARLIYAEIGTVIARRDHDSVTRRAVVPTWRKIWLLARAYLARHHGNALLHAPPLEPTRFLVRSVEEIR